MEITDHRNQFGITASQVADLREGQVVTVEFNFDNGRTPTGPITGQVRRLSSSGLGVAGRFVRYEDGRPGQSLSVIDTANIAFTVPMPENLQGVPIGRKTPPKIDPAARAARAAELKALEKLWAACRVGSPMADRVWRLINRILDELESENVQDTVGRKL